MGDTEIVNSPLGIDNFDFFESSHFNAFIRNLDESADFSKSFSKVGGLQDAGGYLWETAITGDRYDDDYGTRLEVIRTETQFIFDTVFKNVDGLRLFYDLSPADPLLPSSGDMRIGYTFDAVQAIAGVPVRIDPAVATGYRYSVTGGPLISEASFQAVAGDSDGYDLYDLGDLIHPIGHVGGADPLSYSFASAVSGFELRGIDPAAGLDPANSQAFVTGLTFDRTGVVSITQTPLTQSTGTVPEPATWAMMLGGFGAMGAAMRRRRVALA